MSYEESSDWQPSTSHIPLAKPPENHTQTVHFIVTLTGTDPPPNWADDQLVILRKEMASRFGSVCTSVEPGYLTKTGKLLTEADIERLSTEAEQAGAYDVSNLLNRLRERGEREVDHASQAQDAGEDQG
jgi:hypothetical protein